jgi:hypothetical protein
VRAACEARNCKTKSKKIFSQNAKDSYLIQLKFTNFLVKTINAVFLFALMYCHCTFNPGQTSGPNQITLPEGAHNGTAVIKGYVAPDPLFPFILDSAIVSVSSSNLPTTTWPISISGDSVLGTISGIPIGSGRIITVLVYDHKKTSWCIAKDTGDFSDAQPVYVRIKLIKVQPNEFPDAIIPGHQLKADEIWSGQCRLIGDIIVPTSTTLTIMPGATIKIAIDQADWDSGWSSKNKVEICTRGGSIVAQGNSNAIISLVPDSSVAKIAQWWGIGCNGGSVTMSYCHVSGASYGIFVFSGKGVLVCDHCLFSYVDQGITDFGLGNIYSKMTFSNGSYAFFIFGNNKTVDISFCDFVGKSFIDIEAVDSNQNISVHNCNFAAASYNNLYISSSSTGPKGSVIIADNCFNISKVNDDSTGAIRILNPSPSRISDAGCGFTVPYPSPMISLAKRKPSLEQMEKESRLINEKAMVHSSCGQ